MDDFTASCDQAQRSTDSGAKVEMTDTGRLLVRAIELLLPYVEPIALNNHQAMGAVMVARKALEQASVPPSLIGDLEWIGRELEARGWKALP